jgi:hypothetical protein
MRQAKFSGAPPSTGPVGKRSQSASPNATTVNFKRPPFFNDGNPGTRRRVNLPQVNQLWPHKIAIEVMVFFCLATFINSKQQITNNKQITTTKIQNFQSVLVISGTDMISAPYRKQLKT